MYHAQLGMSTSERNNYVIICNQQVVVVDQAQHHFHQQLTSATISKIIIE